MGTGPGLLRVAMYENVEIGTHIEYQGSPDEGEILEGI